MALLVIDTVFISFLTLQTALLFILYVVLNVLYSIYLKHIAIVDVLLISSFYVLRVIVGGFAANVPVSNWLIITIIFLSLFLILGKRKSEQTHESPRSVMGYYSDTFLNTTLAIAASLTIISYSLYILIVHNIPLAVYSIFFVLMGVMRYLLLIFNNHNIESPEKILWQDGFILASILGWIILMYFLFYSSLIGYKII